MLGDLDLARRPNSVEHLTEDHHARRRSSAPGQGAGPAPGAARPGSSRDSSPRIRSHSRGAEQVAVDALGVVRVQAPGRSPPATSPCRRRRSRAERHARRAAGTASAMIARDVGGQRRPAPPRSADRGAGGARSGARRPPASRRGKSTSCPAPITSSVEPPPMSSTSVGVRSSAVALAGRARGTSAAPPRRRSARAARARSGSRTVSANSWPLAESRTALVSTATAVSQSWSSISRPVAAQGS